jgi:hypothetical protein
LKFKHAESKYNTYAGYLVDEENKIQKTNMLTMSIHHVRFLITGY